MFGFLQKRDTWRLSKITKDGRGIGTQLLRMNPSARKRDFPHLVYFTLPYQGVPVPRSEEFDVFDKVDANLNRLEPELGFVTVGVMTLHGKRDWVLYARDGQAVMTALLHEMGEFGAQMETQFDPTWHQYREMVSMPGKLK